MTSVVRFFKGTELGSVFDDQATKAMGEAFEAACKVFDEAGQSSVVYEAVAKCIIEIAKSGERDPNQLRDSALTAVGHERFIPLRVTNPHRISLIMWSGGRVVAIARSPFAEALLFSFAFSFAR
jgi:hypothetical protein